MANGQRGAKTREALLRRLRKCVHDYARNAHADRPSILYHYTNLGGFRGIIQSRTFWVTAFQRARDTYELRHPIASIVAAGRKLALEYGDGTPERVICNHFCDQFERLPLTILPNTRTYVGSLCTSADDPALWPDYGDKGRGLCIGFNMKDEKIVGEHRKLSTSFMRVMYDELEQLRRFTESARTILDEFKKSSFSLRADRDVGLQCCLELLSLAANVCCASKSSDYVHEKEWRLVIVTDDPPRHAEFHDDADGTPNRLLYPLRKVEGMLPSLASIHIGPHSELTIDEVRAFLEEQGYGAHEHEMPELVKSTVQLHAMQLTAAGV